MKRFPADGCLYQTYLTPARTSSHHEYPGGKSNLESETREPFASQLKKSGGNLLGLGLLVYCLSDTTNLQVD